MSTLLALAVGCAAGILSALGLGGGTLLLLLLTLFAGVEQRTAQGINLLFFLPVSAAALPSHGKNGYLRRGPVLWAAAAGALTAALTAWLATGLETGLLRRGFGVYLLAVGLHELLRPGHAASQDHRRDRRS